MSIVIPVITERYLHRVAHSLYRSNSDFVKRCPELADSKQRDSVKTSWMFFQYVGKASQQDSTYMYGMRK